MRPWPEQVSGMAVAVRIKTIEALAKILTGGPGVISKYSANVPDHILGGWVTRLTPM